MQAQMACSQAVHLDLTRAKTKNAKLKHDLETEQEQSFQA
jgi:hypothetical protein